MRMNKGTIGLAVLLLITAAPASAQDQAAAQPAPWASASDETGRPAASAASIQLTQQAAPGGPAASQRGAAVPRGAGNAHTSSAGGSQASAPSNTKGRRSAAAGGSAGTSSADVVQTEDRRSAAAGASSAPAALQDADRYVAERGRGHWGWLGLLGLFGLAGLFRRRHYREEYVEPVPAAPLERSVHVYEAPEPANR